MGRVGRIQQYQKDSNLDKIFDGMVIVKHSETKKQAGSNESVKHSWIFDLTGCTVKQIVDAAVVATVIRLQGQIRTHWTKNGKPKYAAGEVKVKMADLLTGRGGIVPTVASVTAEINALSAEERAKLLEQLLAEQE